MSESTGSTPPISLTQRLVRSALGMIPGIALGVFANQVLGYSPINSAVLGFFTVAAGVGLAQPEVSAANVAAGTVGVIAARNVPQPFRDQILDAAIGHDHSKSNKDESPPA
jgi:hypothetical protein